MGKSSRGLFGGAASGAAAGPSIGGPWGAGIGGILGGLAGSNTDGETPQQVQQVDPAFVNHLYNQSMGTEQTAADLKMKAAFDQTLAQQVAAARAARGVNPGLLQRNVSRVAAEQGARAAEQGAIENLRNQDDARGRYLQAMGLNQNAQTKNSASKSDAEERDSKRTGALINGLAGAGALYATAKGTEPKYDGENAVTDPINTSNLTLSDSPNKAQEINSAYGLGADTSINTPQYDLSSKSDMYSKTKIKPESLKVVSDERQKDLIKNESLPANGNMGQQIVQAQQPNAAPTMQQQIQTNMPAPVAAPATAPVQPPAPVPASQTALAQANTSLAKGGNISDLQVKQTEMKAPAEGPTPQEIMQMTIDAKNRQTRDIFGNVTQSDAENYQANLGRWYAKQAEQRAAFQKETDDVNKNNLNIDSERSARLSKFYTGNSNTNANDVAQMYQPKNKLADASWGAGQQAYQNAQSSAPLLSQNPFAHLLATSDERAKTDIKSESNSKLESNMSKNADMNPKHFLDKLNAYSYEYKQGQKSNPKAGEGKYLSVMAQDLEKAGPVGASMVQSDNAGTKQVDYGKGFGTILAAQVHLNERLKQLEGKKGKV